MNYILEYYQAIRSGKIIVGRWIDLIFSQLVHGIEDGIYSFDAKEANRAIKFIETFCHHCKGRCDLIKLELWQKAIVSAMFGIMDQNGNRQFREVVIVVGRKNGKSLFAAAIAAYLAFCDGEYGADVYCVAPKLDQAEIVYSSIWQTISAEPELMQLVKRRKSDYYISSTNTVIKKVAFNAKKSDGFNPHGVICDEIASWPGDQGLKQYEVFKSAFGARKQPMLISISTSGYINEGIYDELIKRSTRVLLGDSKEQRLLPFLYMIDDLSKWNDINELQKSMPNLGVSVTVDYLLEEIAVAEGSLSKKAEFICKYCCIKQSSSQAWLPAAAVEAAAGEHLNLEDFRSMYCTGGIDLSRTTDLTCSLVEIERDTEIYIFAQFFLPKEKLEEATARDGLPYQAYVERGFLTLSGENYVDYEDCYEWFRSLVNEYEILPLETGYDRYSAIQLVEKMKRKKFKMDDVFQGYNLTSTIREFEGLLRDGKIHIGDNDLLKVHLLNAALQMENSTERVKLVKLSATAHVDGTAAALDATCMRQKYWQEYGKMLQNKR